MLDSKHYWVIVLVIIVLVLLGWWYFKSMPLYTYRIKFVTMWGTPGTENIIGYSMPPLEGPHTGNMFLIQHDPNFNLFRVGDYASAGIAESSMFGTNNGLIKEANGYKYYTKDVLQTPGERSFTITYDPQNPLFSFVTMIAPSSNWFTGVSSINMTGLNQSLTVGKSTGIALYAFDAGVDHGDQFKTFPKMPREEKIPISYIKENSVLFPDSSDQIMKDAIPSFGYLHIERVA
jgi:hypothetical protein